MSLPVFKVCAGLDHFEGREFFLKVTEIGSLNYVNISEGSRYNNYENPLTRLKE